MTLANTSHHWSPTKSTSYSLIAQQVQQRMNRTRRENIPRTGHCRHPRQKMLEADSGASFTFDWPPRNRGGAWHANRCKGCQRRPGSEASNVSQICFFKRHNMPLLKSVNCIRFELALSVLSCAWHFQTGKDIAWYLVFSVSARYFDLNDEHLQPSYSVPAAKYNTSARHLDDRVLRWCAF